MIQNRTEGFNKTLNDFAFNLNSTGAVRILDRNDSSSAGDSYLNRVKKLNKTHLAQTTNGFQCSDKMVYLQVRGTSQLHKEINQTSTIEEKVIFSDALHRNEITDEYEGDDQILNLYKSVKNSRGQTSMSLRSPKPLELNPDTAPKELLKNESELSMFSGLDKEKMTRNPS